MLFFERRRVSCSATMLGYEDFAENEKFKMLVNKGGASIDVRLKDWYAGGK
ncbi:MAG TPA: hypothetical protein VN958_06270 [Chitinophagaceae bacterium]|nr:hypothetical protein [Chitinophagaceae bacterium]